MKDQPDRVSRPEVTLSYAQSLDGSIAALRGSPLTLSSPESLRLTHQLRAAHHGILVGIGTVIADNPQLTARKVNGANPRPIILDSRLRTPIRAKLLQRNRCAPWIMTTREACPNRQRVLEEAGAKVVRVPGDKKGLVNLVEAMDYLKANGVGRLMVEGGARVITAFLSQKLVDQLIVTIAPVLVGGQRSLEQLLLPSPAGLNPDTAESAAHFPSLKDIRYKQLGKDLIVWGTFDWEAS